MITNTKTLTILLQDNLADKLEKSMKQVDHYRIASEENQNTSRALKRENDRMKGQVRDLGQQVQVRSSFSGSAPKKRSTVLRTNTFINAIFGNYG